MELLRKMLGVTTLSQMLWEGETLRCMSAAAKRWFPTAREGDSLERLMSRGLEEYRCFSGAGSMAFDATVCSVPCRVTVTTLENYRLMTLHPEEEAPDRAELLSAAQNLRESLTGMIVAKGRLLPQLQEEPDNMKYAAILNQSAYNILRITENLELYARQEPILQLQSVSAEEWFREVAGRLEPLCRSAMRTLKWEFTGKDVCLQMDAGKITRTVTQLVANAIKFTESGGSINLSASCDGRKLRICVRDDGAGIAGDQIGWVFSHGRERSGIPDAKWGAGLGLGVVKKLVQAHGGSVMLESREGAGTAVYLTLPVRKGEMTLHSPVMVPASVGMDPYLVGLSDVLPAELFDTRGVDG